MNFIFKYKFSDVIEISTLCPEVYYFSTISTHFKDLLSMILLACIERFRARRLDILSLFTPPWASDGPSWTSRPLRKPFAASLGGSTRQRAAQITRVQRLALQPV